MPEPRAGQRSSKPHSQNEVSTKDDFEFQGSSARNVSNYRDTNKHLWGGQGQEKLLPANAWLREIGSPCYLSETAR